MGSPYFGKLPYQCNNVLNSTTVPLLRYRTSATTFRLVLLRRDRLPFLGGLNRISISKALNLNSENPISRSETHHPETLNPQTLRAGQVQGTLPLPRLPLSGASTLRTPSKPPLWNCAPRASFGSNSHTCSSIRITVEGSSYERSRDHNSKSISDPKGVGRQVL